MRKDFRDGKGMPETTYGSKCACIDLLSCPDCGADPVNSCTIDVVRGREPHDKNHATARCHECGYVVSIATAEHPGAIRRVWNVRTR